MSRSAKVSAIVIGLVIAGSLPTILGCVRAYSERGRISPGMDVSSVFIALDQWNLCLNSSPATGSQQFRMFNVVKEPSGQTYRVPQYDKTFRSKGEFLDFVEPEMSGRAWNSQFTYLAGPVRNTFRVDFNDKGKVVNVSSMAGGP